MNVRLAEQNGAYKVEINGGIIEPLSFKTFRPACRNVSDFAKAGVRIINVISTGLNSILGVPYSLYGESWVGDRNYDFDVVDRQMEFFIKNAPDAYFALNIQVDTRPWYLKENPGCPNSFLCLSQVADDQKWRKAASDYLKAMIRHAEDKFGDRIYGYFILGGTTTEWFSDKDYGETHPYKEAAYKKYMRNPGITIPDKAKREQCSKGSFRDPVLDREAIDYWKFHNELIADTVLFFASKAQEVICHKKLVGVFFGYLFELSGERLWNAGHLAYEKVFQSGDIDMIATPSSYQHRSHNGTSAFMVPYDTLALHNKLQFLSFDNITHMAPQYIDGHAIPGYDSKLTGEQQVIDVMRRDFMLCMTKGSGHHWFDMFEGWFYSDGLMKEVKHLIELSKRISAIKKQRASEVAVFAEGESLYYMDKNAGMNTDILGRQREGLARMGAPYDIFSICDIDHPGINHDQYKLYIFLDAFKISPWTRRTIEEKIKTNHKTILWIYAPNYVQENGVSIEGIRDITGIRVKLSGSIDSLVKADCAKEGVFAEEFGFTGKVKTLFYAEDDEATVWGRYSADGKAALAYNWFDSYTSFYSAVGNLPGNVLRNIAGLAGIHIYNYGNDPVYVNDRLIGVYSDTDGEINLVLKSDAELEELFDGGIYRTENRILNIPALKGNTKLFLRKV